MTCWRAKVGVVAASLLAFSLTILPAGQCVAQLLLEPRQSQVERRIDPRETDPGITLYTEPNVVVFNTPSHGVEPLVVFLPGTGGSPRNTPFFTMIANSGYRVINLEYDDTPAVNVACARSPDPECTARFRRNRIYADAASEMVNTPSAESIVNRLVKLLRLLNDRYPAEKWGGYLAGDRPNWPRIVVCGLSQGAGMAAYIAKYECVRRVVLFSSPWDFTGRDKRPAPWLYAPPATPTTRWAASYHEKENTAPLIRQAYRALGIPQSNVFVLTAGLPEGVVPKGPNPYHGSSITNPAHALVWERMFGEAASTDGQ